MQDTPLGIFRTGERHGEGDSEASVGHPFLFRVAASYTPGGVLKTAREGTGVATHMSGVDVNRKYSCAIVCKEGGQWSTDNLRSERTSQMMEGRSRTFKTLPINDCHSLSVCTVAVL